MTFIMPLLLHSSQFDSMTFKQITDRLLKKSNCSVRCNLGYVQDLHRSVYIDIDIINTHPEPKKSVQCRMIKENLLYLLDNFASFKKNAPNLMIK